MQRELDPISKALRSLAELLRDELRRDRGQLEELRQRILIKEEAERALADFLSVGREPQKAKDQVAPRRSANLMDHVHSALLEHGGPLHYRRIAQLLTDRGVFIPGRNPSANLLAYMARDGRFCRVGRGLYAVAGAPRRARKPPRPRRVKAGLESG